jgi:hypothetical protein
VSGAEYPAAQQNQILASLIGYIQFTVLIFVLFGQMAIDKFQINVPEFVTNLMEKKLIVCMVAFLVGGMIKSQLLATGAFEIYFDDQIVFSKLQTDTPPSEEMLNALFRTYNIL